MVHRKVKLIQPTEEQIRLFGNGSIARFDNISLVEYNFRIDLSPLVKTGHDVFYFWGDHRGDLANARVASKDIDIEKLPWEIKHDFCGGFMQYGFNGGVDYRGIDRGTHYIVGNERKLKRLYVKWMKDAHYEQLKLEPHYGKIEDGWNFFMSERRQREWEANDSLRKYFSRGYWYPLKKSE